MPNSKKIGIVTFHKVKSYGALLQSYALLQTLKELCPTAEVGLIDLYPERFSKHSDDNDFNLFRDFSTRYLNTITAAQKTLKECLQSVLEPSQPVTDLICGSDQIWNPQIVKECLKDYFMHGDLDKVNKFSFAASFGVNNLSTDSETTRIITEALAEYKKISVREASGIELCKQFGRNDAINVLDPTLTANPEIFSKFRQHNLLADKVCGFFLAQKKYHPKILKKISKLLHTQPLMLGKKAPLFSFIPSCPAPAVEDFISAISNASCVVTDSFHGVCFSIIFRKQFIVLPSHRKERFVRIAELLEALDLQDRIVEDHSKAASQALVPIDYDKVYTVLIERRRMSRDFLKSCFTE